MSGQGKDYLTMYKDSTEGNTGKISSGLQHTKSGEFGKSYGHTTTYKGWRVIIYE